VNKVPLEEIYIAARENDIGRLQAALSAGQHLSMQRPENGFTPLHTAALNGSVDFIQEALKHPSADPWLRDHAGRLAIDHSDVRREYTISRLFFDAMYPEGRLPHPVDP